MVPSPSWPMALFPQHFTVPPPNLAQEWLLPVAIEVAVLIPATVTGEDEVVMLPSPSCPWALYPQHFTVPLVKTAQEWY